MDASIKYENVFPKRLREALEVKKLTQYELAKRLGVRHAAVNHLACGRRSPSMLSLARIADALCMSTDFLLGRTDAPGLCGPAADELATVAAGLSERDLATVITLAKSLAASEKK